MVIGNPPYNEKAKGLGGWVGARGKALRAPLDDWQLSVSWDVGAYAKHLRNLYVYFWRWADLGHLAGFPTFEGPLEAACRGKGGQQEGGAVPPHLRNRKPGDKHVNKAIREGLGGRETRTQPSSDDSGQAIAAFRYAFRPFDRQWIIPDARLINQPNPTLWALHSHQQVYLTCAA